MNITRENIDDLNALLTVEIKKDDYSGSMEKTLRDYRRKANVKGFRPGMVPIGLIKKMYGNAVKLDEINKIVSESIKKYLTDEKIEILGDPLPRTEENEKIDLDTQDDFQFRFELGIAPQVEIDLGKKNKVTYYEISIDEKIRNDYISNYTRRFGEFRIQEETGDSDMLKGNIVALGADGEPLAEGPAAENVALTLSVIKDDESKKLFISKKSGDSIDFDLRKALPNDYEIAGILRKQKEEVADVNGMFRFTISEINRFIPAELNKDLFDKIYGEGVVSTEEEFKTRLEEEIKKNLKNESEYKLGLDIKKLIQENTEFALPEDFLKRWLLAVNEKTTADQVDKEFDSFRKDLKWQLIRNKVARDNEIKITEDELHHEAENITRYQFQQYGLFYATDEQVHNYAVEMLKREDDAKRIAERILEEKAIEKLKEVVKLENKEVTADEFNKLFGE